MTTYSKIILTKSGVEQAAPTAGDLDLGELAINYNDGKLFFKDGIDSIKVIGSSGSIISAAAHQDNILNPHGVTKSQVGLSAVDNTADSAKEVSGPQQSALNLKANQSTTYNKIEVDNLISTQTGSDITLTDLSMGPVAAASGTGGVTYDNLTGVFTYIPPALSDLGGLLASDISVIQLAGDSAEAGTLLYDGDGEFTFKKPTLSGLGGIGLSGLSVGVEGTPAGDGSLTYDNATGQFIYDQPTLVGLGGHLLTNLSVTNDSPLAGDGSLTYDNATGQFIYDQPTLVGLGGIGYGSLSVSTEAASGNGALSYSNGVFTYTPPVIPAITGSISVDDLTLTGRSNVTQLTSINTGVAINAIAGTITCVTFAPTAHVAQTFTVTNNKVSENDVIILSRKSLDHKEVLCHVTAVANGSFDITHYCGSAPGATTSVINFAIIKTAV
jgi:hypothetical protein